MLQSRWAQLPNPRMARRSRSAIITSRRAGELGARTAPPPRTRSGRRGAKMGNTAEKRGSHCRFGTRASRRTVASTRPEPKETVMSTNSLAGLLGRRRLGRDSLRRAARTGSVAFSAVAVAALGAVAATPAVASTAPSMITYRNNVNIAVQGPNHSLRFYWATDSVQAGAPSGSRARAPPSRRSMTANGNKVDIAVQGPGHSLDLYWATAGVSGWHLKRIAASGTTFSAPSMTTIGNDAFIAMARPGPQSGLLLGSPRLPGLESRAGRGYGQCLLGAVGDHGRQPRYHRRRLESGAGRGHGQYLLGAVGDHQQRRRHHRRRGPGREPGLLLADRRRRHLEPRASGTPGSVR